MPKKLDEQFWAGGPKGSGLAWYLDEGGEPYLRPAPGTKDTEEKRWQAHRLTVYLKAVQRLAKEEGLTPTKIRVGGELEYALHAQELPGWFLDEMQKCFLSVVEKTLDLAQYTYIVPMELPRYIGLRHVP